MLLDYIDNLNSEPIKKWLDNVRGGKSSAAFGVTGGAKYLLSAISGKRFLYIARDRVSARSAANEIAALTGKKTVFLPAKDDVLLFKRIFDKNNYYERITALGNLKDAHAVVTTTEALLQLMPEKIDAVDLKVNGEYDTGDLTSKLISFGYTRREFADERGTFALRGDIMEVFPINHANAFRLDFFGDELERIRALDEDRSPAEEVETIRVFAAVDFVIGKEEIPSIERKLDRCVSSYKVFQKAAKARSISCDIKEMLESGNLADLSLSFLYPILLQKQADIIDLFPAEAVFFDEPKMIYDYTIGSVNEHKARFETLSDAGEVFDFSVGNMRGESYLEKLFSALPCFSFQNVLSAVKFFSPLDTVKFRITPSNRYTANAQDLFRDLNNWQKTGYKVIIACGSAERQNKTVANAAEHGIVVSSGAAGSGYAVATAYYFSDGFILHDEKIAVIGTCDLFLTGVKEKRIKRKRNDTFVAPEVGDFAVHEDYGIGLIRGTKKIATTDSVKDYVAIEYADGDILYISVEDMDKLTKYTGGSESPQLNKLGNNEFEKIKERVRRSISQMSINLKRLYGERKNSKGFAFSTDNDLTQAFENDFPYELTEDQAQSLSEIKSDMESTKIMDRLLLGDVGFGKTEVALRAAFKAVMDGKQAAIVAPTTVLVEQHYKTVSARCVKFGVKVGVLDRFQKPSAVKKTIEGLASGDIDIVVGTHRLFGKDVKFRDLGFLILDEEQRFGVEHKEKLRDIKRNVDTLTMSATPIPRTLHMSLTGIRDISLIMTPPVSRIPVQSYVVEESDALIRDAVMKELSRNGQTFILYNNVENIYKFSAHVREILPEAKIVVGHGQMTREQLEDNILAFYDGKFDVLIATTIIENGIDIPRANTLIVIDADKLGLFSLYQLKGRVGRSDRMAHAYFTYKENKVLSDAAYKRLDALMENTELGSGYKIAMRDLEIRGAGNVLGREQHGHMEKIGYELYSKLLKEQLGEVTKDFETELDVRMDAFIPESYVENSASRLDLYKALAEICSEEDEKRVMSSAEQNYGAPPTEVCNLALIARLKNLCRKKEVIKLVLDKKGGALTFKDLNSLSDGGVLQAAEKFKDSVALTFTTNPQVLIRIFDAKKAALFALEFLNFASERAN